MLNITYTATVNSRYTDIAMYIGVMVYLSMIYYGSDRETMLQLP